MKVTYTTGINNAVCGVISLTEGITDILRTPDTPGVYIMKDDKGSVIYIGKAISLKKGEAVFPTAGRWMQRPADGGPGARYRAYYSCNELKSYYCNLIKSHRPKYNILLKDDTLSLY